MTEQARKRIFLFDGHSLCYQAFHAIPPLTSPDGSPVNAVLGFLNTLMKVIRDERPDYVGVAFDAPEATFRHVRRATYKAQRPAMPETLRPQIDVARRLALEAGVPCYQSPGFEADDLLATLAAQAVRTGVDAWLVTNDKDVRQLLSETVTIYNPRKEAPYTTDDLRRETGLSPEQMVDYYSLVGDASDNIKGAEGVGPKTAQALLARFGTLDELLTRLDEVEKPALRGKIAAARERILENRDLIRLRRDVPATLDLAPPTFMDAPPPPFRESLERMGFRKILAALGSPAAPPRAQPPAPGTGTPLSVDVPRSIDALRAAVRALSGAGSLGLAVIPREPGRHRSPAAAVGFAAAPGRAVALALTENVPVPPAEALRDIQPLLADARTRKFAWSFKDLMLALPHTTVNAGAGGMDLSVAGALLDPDRPPKSLTELARTHLDEALPPPPEADDGIFADPDETAAACARAAETALRLAPRLRQALAAEGIETLFDDIEMPLVPVLAEMEATGVRIDETALRDLARDVEKQIAALAEEAQALAGRPFNPASPAQLSAVLFGDLGLPRLKRTKTGHSTDSDVLEALAERHPLPGVVLAHRQLMKLKSTYLDALPRHVDPLTGRLHARFHQTGAATGRLSSSDPNLQNVPIRSDIGRRIRAAFLPIAPGHVLLSADYSQIEFRILAHLSGDPALTEAFLKGRDVHVFVASRLYDAPEERVTDRMRHVAKGVGYSLIYGKTPFSLARDLKIPAAEATALIEGFFQRFARVRAFREEILTKARVEGRVRTILGRIRRVPDINAASRGAREAAERMAVNAVVQGSAADLMKKAMVGAHRALARAAPGARLLAQIHDELLLDVPVAEVDAAREAVVREMEGALTLGVPLAVNVGTGANWLEAHGG